MSKWQFRNRQAQRLLAAGIIVIIAAASLLSLRTTALGMVYPAQDEPVGPRLFLVTVEAQDLLPSLTEHVRFHTRLTTVDDVHMRYVVSGGAADGEHFTAAGLDVQVLDMQTTGKVYLWLVGTIEGLNLTSHAGIVLYEGVQEVLIAFPQVHQDAAMDTLMQAGRTIRELSADQIAGPRFPDQESRALRTTAGCQLLVVNGGFEESSQWRFGPTPFRARTVTAPVHGDLLPVQMGIPDGNANRLTHSAVYQQVTIPATAKQATLTYREQPHGASDSRDWREALLLTTNYQTIRVLDRAREAGNGEWTQRTFDVSDLRGRTVVLYFNVYNNGSGSQMWSYLDDVSLQVCDDEPTAQTATITPTIVPTDTPVGTPVDTATPTPTLTPTATPVDGQMIVRAGSVDGRRQTSISVPLDLADVPSDFKVGVVSVAVLYDEEALQATQCNTSQNAFDLVQCNSALSGVVLLSTVSSQGVMTNTRLANIDFTLTGNKRGTSDLVVVIRSAEDVDGTLLSARGDEGRVTLGCMMGDVNCNDQLDATDALFIRQFDAGQRGSSQEIPPPSGTLHEPACDVNADEQCNIADALPILQCAVGIVNTMCPSGTITLPPLPDPVLQSPQAVISIPSATLEIGASSKLLVTAKSLDRVATISLEVAYDPQLVRATACTVDPLKHFDIRLCNIDVNTGVVRLTLLAPAGVSDQAALAEIDFEAIDATAARGTDSPDVVELRPAILVKTFVDVQGNSVPAQVIGAGKTDTEQRVFMPLISR